MPVCMLAAPTGETGVFSVAAALKSPATDTENYGILSINHPEKVFV